MTQRFYSPIPFAEVAVNGPFWRERLDTVLARTIPSQHAKLGEAGASARREDYRSGVWSEAWGREAVRALFKGGPGEPDGLFCGNDQIARGAADALRELGVRVPDDVAIVGFDNWNVMSDAARPPLTSVDMNLDALGREAGASLMEMMAGRRLAGVRRLPCSLVIRDSCGARWRGERKGR